MSILTLAITFLSSLLKSQRQLRLENLALRQQVAMHHIPRVDFVNYVGLIWSLLPRGIGPYFFPGCSYYLPVSFEGVL